MKLFNLLTKKLKYILQGSRTISPKENYPISLMNNVSNPQQKSGALA